MPDRDTEKYQQAAEVEHAPYLRFALSLDYSRRWDFVILALTLEVVQAWWGSQRYLRNSVRRLSNSFIF